jgi:tetratricopeptide (TPR) repeat protein
MLNRQNIFHGILPGNRNLNMLMFIAALFCVSQSIYSQTFIVIDTNTYNLYLEKDWDELIREGKKALRQDVDYYNLRMRIGIAYYEKKNYKLAQCHFRKALKFNNGDTPATEYLYYAYLLGGQIQQAELVYKNFRASQKEKIPSPGSKIIDRISVEYLYSQVSTDDLINDRETFEGIPYGTRIITRNFQNLNAAFHHHMHPGTSFTHAYTYLGKTSFYHYDNGLDSLGTSGHKVNQHQYYISPLFTLRGGLVIRPAFHFLHVSYQVPILTGTGPGPGGWNDIVFRNETQKQLVGGLTLMKYQGPYIFRLGAVYSNLNRADQLTGSMGLTWYPLGNLDLYAGASLNAHFNDLDKAESALIPDLLIGWSIASKVWMEISGSYGEMKNYSESNAYIIYNSLDWMKYKALATLMVPLTEKGSLVYAGVRYAGYENQFIPLDQNLPADLYNLNYNSLSIFGGISWKL